MISAVNTRELILDMLLEINEKGQYSHLVLRSVLDKYQYLSKQERSFMTRITEGTLERLIELDYIINAFSKIKVNKMKPFIRSLLRMSVYQIKYMEAVPDSAVCNEAVKLAKKHGFGNLGGFVNGILRTVSREYAKLAYPEKEKQPLLYYSVTYSMPEWIVQQWLDDYGQEKTEQILEGFQKETPLTIRTNLLKCAPQELRKRLEDEGARVVPYEGLPYAFFLSGFDYLNGLASFQEGLFYVQDISSMMVAELAEPKKDMYVIDVCAAPGGKSSHIAELLCGSGMVEARDLTDYKVSLIEETISRHGLSNMKAVCMDATVFDEASVEKADILICDLPCSGLGVIGKKTDIRYKMTKEQTTELVALQRKILETVHTYVKPQGVLLYSTCTIDKAENEENVRWLLEKYPEFSLLSQRQILPQEAGQDGFFIAKLKRG